MSPDKNKIGKYCGKGVGSVNGDENAGAMPTLGLGMSPSERRRKVLAQCHGIFELKKIKGAHTTPTIYTSTLYFSPHLTRMHKTIPQETAGCRKCCAHNWSSKITIEREHAGYEQKGEKGKRHQHRFIFFPVLQTPPSGFIMKLRKASHVRMASFVSQRHRDRSFLCVDSPETRRNKKTRIPSFPKCPYPTH